MAAYSVEGEVAHSITAAVETGSGHTHNRTQNENGLHTLRYADDRATLKMMKIPGHVSVLL
jgi:hypothetical protein